MARPQLEDGYCKIANELMEALGKIRIPGEARQVLDVIIRQTYGWNKKEDRIPLSQFVEKTGLKKPNVCRAINKLQSVNLIVVRRMALSKTIMSVIEKDNAVIPNYSINKDYETWRPLSKKIIVIKNDNKSLSETIPSKDTTKDKRYISVFDFWNSRKIIQHKKPTEKIKRKIKSALKDFTEEEIRGAIDNYAIVTQGAGSKYYWPENQKWTLAEFLQRGLDRFLLSADPLKNYLKSGTGKPGSKTDMRQCNNPKKPQCGALFDLKTDERCPKCGWRPI